MSISSETSLSGISRKRKARPADTPATSRKDDPVDDEDGPVFTKKEIISRKKIVVSDDQDESPDRAPTPARRPKRHPPGAVDMLPPAKERKKKEEERNKKERQEEVSVEDLQGITDVTLMGLSAPAIGAVCVEWLNDIEEIRRRSSNIQGKLSGQLKIRVVKVKEAVMALVTKAEAVGDPVFLRMRNNEVSLKLKESEKENLRLKEQLRSLRSRSVSYIGRSVENVEITPDVNYILARKSGTEREDGGGKESNVRGRNGNSKGRILDCLDALPAPMRPPLRNSPLRALSAGKPPELDREEVISRQIAALEASRKELRERGRLGKERAMNKGSKRSSVRILEDGRSEEEKRMQRGVGRE